MKAQSNEAGLASSSIMVWHHRAVQGHLLLTNCLTDEVTRENIELALKENRLLWLDLDDTSDEVLELLRDVFKIHPLSVEDAKEFNQRPKIEDYDDFVSIVAYGARGLGDPLTEVHCFYAENFLVSVHRDTVPAVGDACRTLTRLHTDRRLVALYRLLDALVDTMFPYLAALDDRIDEVQDEIFENPKQEQLAELFALKRQLVDMRKVVSPQRDTTSSMLAQVVPIPGMTPETERYVRDLYDHLIRISDMVDSYRDLLGSSLDAYMSMVSNRLNDVMKQLTIIATVFLPLTFLTGFFGQNLGWLVNRVGSLDAFLIFGVGLNALAVLALVIMFKRRGWMGRGK
jgi:magnesium transporter